jgi:hypothetical protein
MKIAQRLLVAEFRVQLKPSSTTHLELPTTSPAEFPSMVITGS